MTIHNQRILLYLRENKDLKYKSLVAGQYSFLIELVQLILVDFKLIKLIKRLKVGSSTGRAGGS